MKNSFKRFILMALCAVTLLSAVPANAAGIDVDDYKPDPYYTAWSTTDDCIRFPREREYLSTPYVATVYAIRRQVSIYLMPMPESGHGNLGTVGHGKKVLILAKSGGYLFFLTQDGRYGWNGAKYFDKVSNSSAYYDLFPTNGGSYSSPVRGSREGSYGAVREEEPEKLKDGVYYVRIKKVWTTNDVDKVRIQVMKEDGCGPSGAVILKETDEYYYYNLAHCTIVDGDYLSNSIRGERLDDIYSLIDRYGFPDVEITVRDGKLVRLFNYYKP